MDCTAYRVGDIIKWPRTCAKIRNVWKGYILGMNNTKNVRIGLGPISVFCGASEYPFNEKNPFRTENLKHQREIEKFGQILAMAGIPLIWGAGQTGLMGAVSRSVIKHGGVAVGVSTEHLVSGKEGAQAGITTLLIADSMQSRKMAFAKLSRAFVVFPGGIGTFDEVTEYLLERENGEHSKPLIIVNIDGFYDPFLRYFDHLVDRRYMTKAAREMMIVVPGAEEILPAITAEFDKPKKYMSKPKKLYHSSETLIGQHNQIVVRKHHANMPIGRHNYPKGVLGVGSIALVCGGIEDALHDPRNSEHKKSVAELIRLLATEKLPRLIHSGQIGGLKGLVGQLARANGICDLGISTRFLEENGEVDTQSTTLLIADNEQSAEFAIKNLVDAVIIGPGAIDSLEKLSDYLTEVDIKESNQRLIIFNVDGHYDGLIEYFRYLVSRGYFAPAALDKLVIVKTAQEVIDVLKRPQSKSDTPGLMTKDDLIAVKGIALMDTAHNPNKAGETGTAYPRYVLTPENINKLMLNLGLIDSDQPPS